MEHFLKIVHTLLERHTPFKSFSKKSNIYNSKPWITTGIAISIKMKHNLYKKFSNETNFQQKAEYQTNLGSIRTIFPVSLDVQKTHIAMDFLKKTKEVLEQSGKQLRN